MKAMSLRSSALGLVAICISGVAPFAQEFRTAAHQLRRQDEAFSLLLASFRQVQSGLIMADYDSRLRAAAALHEAQARSAVGMLADLELELRKRKLTAQMHRLELTYEYARRDDQREAGIVMPSAVDVDAAEAKVRNFVPVATLDVNAPVFADTSAVKFPIAFRAPIALLRRYGQDHGELPDIVAATLSQSSQPGRTPPPMIVVSYRQTTRGVEDLVVQTFNNFATSTAPVTRSQGRLPGGELFSPLENCLRLLRQTSQSWCGPVDAVRIRQRAFMKLLEGDPTLIREQTVEPLHVAMVLTETDAFLPRCLRGRVRAVLAHVELTFNQWRGEVRLISPDSERAVQVAGVLAGWHALALPVAEAYGGRSTKNAIMQALQDASIGVSDQVVYAEGAVPAQLSARALSKLLHWSTEALP